MKVTYFDAKYDYLVWVDYLISTYGRENVVLVYPMIEKTMTSKQAQEKLELVKSLAEVFGVKLYCGDYLGLAESTVIQMYNDINEYESNHTDSEMANDYCVSLSKRYEPGELHRMFANSIVSMYAKMLGVPEHNCTYMFKKCAKNEVALKRVFRHYPGLNEFKDSITV